MHGDTLLMATTTNLLHACTLLINASGKVPQQSTCILIVLVWPPHAALLPLTAANKGTAQCSVPGNNSGACMDFTNCEARCGERDRSLGEAESVVADSACELEVLCCEGVDALPSLSESEESSKEIFQPMPRAMEKGMTASSSLPPADA
jgi:hypothetical protein